MDRNILTYVLVSSPRTNADASASVARDWAEPVHVSGRTSDLAALLSEARVTDLDEEGRTATWCVPLETVGAALERRLEPAVAQHLIVEVTWPVSDAAETLLLLARLNAPELRLAVSIAPAELERAFFYFNRLALSWFAIPVDGRFDRAWADALRTVARLWCLDPRVRTAVEPVQSAFGRAVATRTHAPCAWSYRVIADASGAPRPCRPWTPSAHALLVAAPHHAAAGALDSLVEFDAEWTGTLEELCATLPLPASTPSVAARG